ncbi:MAG TPA: hypothetical protein VEI54_02040, partial [Candidatus Limnocylindrales bacterium]|nr:hypothetical protein [Candidatus Limnocylindrales bacterium]
LRHNLSFRTFRFSHLPVVAYVLLTTIPALSQQPPATPPTCRVESVAFEGWHSEQISNPWVKLIIVPQLGGRLMQVYFDGHPYLFVNPKFKGQYIPPAEAVKSHRWINYGGDKIWPMPEGSQDEHHWPGPISDPLDDGEYTFTVLSQTPSCTIRLDGPPDPATGLQYSREVTLAADSPEIRFHAIMKNISDHPIQWSVQSVTQYDTSDPQSPESYNRNFWAFTPANPNSTYLDRYHVRSGLADDPSFRIEHDLFTLQWLPLQNEVWLDSAAGWLAVVDAASQYAMVEHFRYVSGGDYPGKATVIFYKNGGAVHLNEQGLPAISSQHPDNIARYLEAELNSPIVPLTPGKIYAMDTVWHPVRVGKELLAVTDAGVSSTVLRATRTSEGLSLRGSFGVFFPGHLEAQFFDSRSEKIAQASLQSVNPVRVVDLQETVAAPGNAAEVSIHLIDSSGKDCGTLGSAKIASPETKQK